MLNKRADKLELLRIAEAVALEKAIDKELIINSMETGIAKAAKSKFGQENEIKVSINRENGDIEIFRKLTVSENPENSNTEIKLNDAINLPVNKRNYGSRGLFSANSRFTETSFETPLSDIVTPNSRSILAIVIR